MNRTASKAWRAANPKRTMLNSARGHAKHDGVLFDLTIEDIIIPDKCPVFGTSFTSGQKEHNPSLDRVQPDLGYVSGNVRVISWRANRLKHNMKLEEIEAIARYIREHIGYTDARDVTVRTYDYGTEVLTHKARWN